MNSEHVKNVRLFSKRGILNEKSQYSFPNIPVLILLAALAIASPITASAATTAQADRARACNVPEVDITRSLDKAELLSQLDVSTSLANRGTGPVRIIEFFDYNCPVCRSLHPGFKAFAEQSEAIQISYVELGMFGRGSVQASLLGLAILEQDQDAYLRYHDALMSTSGRVSRNKARDVADMLEIDNARAVQRAKSEDILARRESNESYFDQLGMEATPGLVVDGIILTLDQTAGQKIGCLLAASVSEIG